MEHILRISTEMLMVWLIILPNSQLTLVLLLVSLKNLRILLWNFYLKIVTSNFFGHDLRGMEGHSTRGKTPAPARLIFVDIA